MLGVLRHMPSTTPATRVVAFPRGAARRQPSSMPVLSPLLCFIMPSGSRPVIFRLLTKSDSPTR
eukprot:5078229-Pyramimonas_sp.AAC.1